VIKSFGQFLSESAQKEVVCVLSRFNPPTAAHEKLLEAAADLASGKTYRIYSSKAEDPKKNPLVFSEKVKYVRKMFPRHARAIMADSDVGNYLHLCSKLYSQGFSKVTLIVEQSKLDETRTLLKNYNGRPLKEGGFFNFENGVQLVAITDSVEMSSMKLLEAASINDLEVFSKSLPESFLEVKEMFNAVRTGLGLRETKNFRKHIQLEPISDRREAYVSGEIFNIGDQVVIKESSEVGTVCQRGSNYLVVTMGNGNKVRKWLNGVELLEKSTVEEISSHKLIDYDHASPGKPISKIRSKS
jgi:hypothetical protein